MRTLVCIGARGRYGKVFRHRFDAQQPAWPPSERYSSVIVAAHAEHPTRWHVSQLYTTHCHAHPANKSVCDCRVDVIARVKRRQGLWLLLAITLEADRLSIVYSAAAVRNITKYIGTCYNFQTNKKQRERPLGVGGYR